MQLIVEAEGSGMLYSIGLLIELRGWFSGKAGKCVGSRKSIIENAMRKIRDGASISARFVSLFDEQFCR